MRVKLFSNIITYYTTIPTVLLVINVTFLCEVCHNNSEPGIDTAAGPYRTGPGGLSGRWKSFRG